jgi:hypothetical protein
MQVSSYAKAIVAALAAALAVLWTVLDNGSAGGASVTAQEWVSIGIAILGSGGLTYAVPNTSPTVEE